jgi:hypothetical protein
MRENTRIVAGFVDARTAALARTLCKAQDLVLHVMQAGLAPLGVTRPARAMDPALLASIALLDPPAPHSFGAMLASIVLLAPPAVHSFRALQAATVLPLVSLLQPAQAFAPQAHMAPRLATLQ